MRNIRNVMNVMTAMLKVGAVLLLALALVAFVSACGGSSGASDDATSRSDGGQVDAAGDERFITIRTEDFQFVPESVTVKVGQTVRLTLDNRDPILHDYTVDEPEFVVLKAEGAGHGHHENKAVPPADSLGGSPAAQVSLARLHIGAAGNERAELVFEATEPGEYALYCSVLGHRQAGMEGTIIVEE